MTLSRKRAVALTAVVIFVCAGWLWLSPEHLLRPFDGNVKVDGKPAPATFYVGNPTHNEADAFVLVHVPECGDYMLDFDDGTYREISRFDFIRFGFGAWTFRSMRKGSFRLPLADNNLNEFRITSRDRRTVTISF